MYQPPHYKLKLQVSTKMIVINIDHHALKWHAVKTEASKHDVSPREHIMYIIYMHSILHQLSVLHHVLEAIKKLK